jgi:hypothetical protein
MTMADELKVRMDDELGAVCQYGPVVYVVWRDWSSLAPIEAADAAIEEMAARYGDGRRLLYVHRKPDLPGFRRQDRALHQAALEHFERHEERFLGAAIAFECSGVAGAIVRAISGGIMAIRRTRVKVQSFGDARDGIHWLGDLSREADPFDPAEMVAALTAAELCRTVRVWRGSMPPPRTPPRGCRRESPRLRYPLDVVRTALLCASFSLIGCVVDVDLSGRACDDEHPCLQAERCITGTCVPEEQLVSCESAADCASSERCVGDRCVPGEEPAGDAGVARDAGGVDAGSPDAGLDAGPRDAGAVDAGNVDAGNVDAGNVDAGNVDAGNVDAGNVDAGNVDAGNVDAGNVDAGNADAGNIDAGNNGENPFCAPLPLTQNTTVPIATTQALEAAFANLQPNTELLLADGTYNLTSSLRIDEPFVTLRSASGDREAVILDGQALGATDEVIRVLASDVTITAVTLRNGAYYGIEVSPGGTEILRTRVHDVHIVDFQEEGIQVAGDRSNSRWTDDGEISCSHVELTSAARGTFDCDDLSGIDLRESAGWIVRDNLVKGMWCDAQTARAGITTQESTRDVLVERNVVVDSRSGIQLGDFVPDPGQRTYGDDPCGLGATVPFGCAEIVARNNLVVSLDAAFLSSTSGPASQIRIINACEIAVIHNSVVTGHTGSTIRINEPQSSGVIVNNVTSADITDDGEQAVDAFTIAGNLEYASNALFVNPAGLDLHLAPGDNTAVNAGAAVSLTLRSQDLDGDPITGAPDVGADERTP